MNITKISFLISLLFLLITCKKENMCDCIKSSGKETYLERNLSSFKNIDIEGKFDLILIQDTIEKIKITGGENILKLIKSPINNQVLQIFDANKCRWVRNFDQRQSIEIHYTSLEKLTIRGAVSTLFKNQMIVNTLTIDHNATRNLEIWIQTPTLNINTYNQSKIKLNGTAGLCSVTLDQGGNIDTRNCLISDLYFFNFSPLDSYVDATNVLGIENYNSGNVYYTTEPAIKKTIKITGKGNVIKL